MSNTQLVRGSLQDVAISNRQSLAKAFMGAEALVLVDISGSMTALDAQGGRSRFSVASDQLVRLQKEQPGKIAVIPWSSTAYFAPSGLPSEPCGGTDLVRALNFIKPADGCGLKIIVISDGEPNDEQRALNLASQFKSKIDTIYIGPENGYGREFLRKLSQVSGGVSVSQSVKEIQFLSQTVTKLISA